MKIVGIYKITSPSGKIYIGQSVSIKQRWKNYKAMNKLNTPIKLRNSLKKYGIENHKFEILEECTIEQLNKKERYWQEYFDVLGKNGLNCKFTETNEKPAIVSLEAKQNMAKAKLGTKRPEEVRKKISKARKGIKLSEKVINNMKLASNKWRKNKIEKEGKLEGNNKRKLIDSLTNITYESIQEASKTLNIKYSKLYYYAQKEKRFKFI